MRVSNGSTGLDLERGEGVVRVRLESTQYEQAALDELPEGVGVSHEDEGCVLAYPVARGAQSLADCVRQARTRLDRLRLAQKLAGLAALSGRLRIPFLHPENIMVDGQHVFVVHYGLYHLMAPQELTEQDFLGSYKALVINVFSPKDSFESLLSGSGALTDGLIQSVNACGSVQDIITLIDGEAMREASETNRRLVLVPRRWYRVLQIVGVLALVCALVLGWFTFSYHAANGRQTAIINAQTDFLTHDYAQTQADLQGYAVRQLPKSARYVLAVSGVNLSDLTATQKQAVLDTLSTKSDDNTVNYWVCMGRGDFTGALNLAQNLGDDQLTLYAYINLYESTKLNTTMNGATKQKLLDQYNQKIRSLSKSLGR
jgi:type VII secretion protein EssB